MRCELEADDSRTFPGVTLFTKKHTRCLKPTAVYFRRDYAAPGRKLNVVIWLHGFFVTDHEFLFHGDPAKIREQVRNSNKDVVLIAPFLGRRDPSHKDYSTGDLATAKWGERYLDEVLSAISRFQSPDSRDPPRLQVGKLVIACHSAGGAAMRNLVASLGKYKSNLRACWGFDCLYGAKATPDDATFWHQWLSGAGTGVLDVIYGPTTIPQSVKLDLMGRGLATAEGDKAEPRRPALKNLNVSMGHHDASPALHRKTRINDDDPASVDRVMLPHVADVAAIDYRKGRHGQYLEMAIANVHKAFRFPKEIHYMIARAGFLDRLRKL